MDLREVTFDVVLVARRQLLGPHHLFDDALVIGVDLRVPDRREALLRGRQDRLARRVALVALLALQLLVLIVAADLRRVPGQVRIVANAPLLAALLRAGALLALPLLTLALTLALLTRLPRA